MGTMILINEYQPDIVINIGLAGGLSNSLEVGDIAISRAACFHDVDLTSFGQKLGQISGYPIQFTADQYLARKVKLCADELNINASYGLVVSGDSFINSLGQLSHIKKNFPEAIAVEMEGASIGQVCYKAELPFLVIRAISDTASQQSHIQFKNSIVQSVNTLSLVFERFLESISEDIKK
jgi:adenosylhomocysteine nucleosidase